MLTTRPKRVMTLWIMTAGVRLGRQRAESLRLVIGLMRNMARSYFGAENFGAIACDVLLCASILVGQVERRPMTPTKLATYAGVPRPTVIRRLRELERLGHVEKIDGHYRLPLDRVNSDPGIACAVETAKHINKVAIELSKLDTDHIAVK